MGRFKDLTEKLVVKILLRLRVRDLKRLKLVCKKLYSLINSSEFKAQHFLLLNREPYIVLSAPGATGTHMLSGGPTNLQLELEGLRFHSYCCCEGVVLIITRRDKIFALWNPATEDFKRIPVDLRELYDEAHDERLSVDSFGCGFDSKNNEYKPFIVLNSMDMDFYTEIRIYSFKENKWRSIKSSGIVSFGPSRRGETVYADGMSHWVGFSYHSRGEVIISFDICNEVIITTPFSNDIISTYEFPFYSPPDCPYPLPFNDTSFALVKRYRNPSRKYYEFHDHDDVKRTTSFDMSHFDVWALGECGNKNSWTKLFTIGPLHGIEYVLGFWNQTKVFVSDYKKYKIVGETAIHGSGGKLFLYDMITQKALELFQSIVPDTKLFTCRQKLYPIADGHQMATTLL